MKILLIDDELDTLTLYSKTLYSLGIKIDICNDENEALSKLNSGDYDYAFVDYKLNTKTSEGLIFAAKGIVVSSETKIYLMTGAPVEVVREKTKFIKNYIVKVIGKSEVEDEFKRLAGQS